MAYFKNSSLWALMKLVLIKVVHETVIMDFIQCSRFCISNMWTLIFTKSAKDLTDNPKFYFRWLLLISHCMAWATVVLLDSGSGASANGSMSMWTIFYPLEMASFCSLGAQTEESFGSHYWKRHMQSKVDFSTVYWLAICCTRTIIV